MILFQCNPFLAVPSSYVKDQHCSVGVDIVQIFFLQRLLFFSFFFNAYAYVVATHLFILPFFSLSQHSFRSLSHRNEIHEKNDRRTISIKLH